MATHNTTDRDAYTVNIALSVTFADIADVWDTALTACGYWADEMAGANGDPGAYYIREREPAGEPFDYVFTGRDIAYAIGKIIAGTVPVDPGTRADLLNGDYDADTADAIIQVATFGELVYG